MNYILLYENFQSGDFYEKVGYCPPSDLNLVEFTNNEVELIKKSFDSRDIQYGSIRDGHKFRITFGRSPNRMIYTTLYRLDLTKSDDEWYYAMIWHNGAYISKDSECYKCDQIEGIIKLIGDLITKLSPIS